MENVIVDIHCHPSFKPYGNSFPSRRQSTAITDKSSTYYINNVSKLEKLIGYSAYRQSSFRSCEEGEVYIVCASLYPMEKGFCRTKAGSGAIIDRILNLFTGISRSRIDAVQDLSNGYFKDLEDEYKFLLSVHNKVTTIDGQKMKYVLVVSYDDIEQTERYRKQKNEEDIHYIYVFLTIEGAHSLFDVFAEINKPTADTLAGVKRNILKIKKEWYAPVFITFTHHFYNGLCGHTESLLAELKQVVDQSYRMNEGLSENGKEVIRALLHKDVSRKKNGGRILIDIKHMNVRSRNDYFQMLDNEYTDENIPVVVSHGAVRGNVSNRNNFYDFDINFSDEEIVRVGRSYGIFGIQLDKRRIASSPVITKFNKTGNNSEQLYEAGKLIWRQIEHIARVLDNAGLYAWGIQCIGSDFDGVINTLDGVWAAKDLKQIQAYIQMNAYNFVQSQEFADFRIKENKQITADAIINRFMGSNAQDFLARVT